MSPTRSGEMIPRVISSISLVLIGFVSVYWGGVLFFLFCGVIGGIMIWEAAQLADPDISVPAAIILGILASLTSLVAAFPAIDPLPAALLVLAVPFGGLLVLRAGQTRFFVFGSLALFAVHILDTLREEFGLMTVLWVITTVIVVDVSGYFVGRRLGGPKLAPRISPKKTWSGALAGWLGAVGVSFIFQPYVIESTILFALFLAVTAQGGDLAESWLKRAAGEKDSSSLLPGHGGFCDRFDGIAGASLGVWIIQVFETSAAQAALN